MEKKSKKIPLSSGRRRQRKRTQQFKVGSRQATTCGARTTLPVVGTSILFTKTPAEPGRGFSITYTLRFNLRETNSRARKKVLLLLNDNVNGARNRKRFGYLSLTADLSIT